MKRMKKITALVLAMMMAFTTLSMPAMAAENDGVMPRMPSLKCPYCGGRAEIVTRSGHYEEAWWGNCSVYTGGHHTHTIYIEEDEFVCLESSCGKKEDLGFTPVREYCNGANKYVS